MATRIERLARRLLLFVAFAAAFVSAAAALGFPAESYVEGHSKPLIAFFPAPHALVPAAASILVALGLFVRSAGLSWMGAGMLIGFSATAFFGLGALYVPVAAVFVFLLSVIEKGARKVKPAESARP